MTTIEPTNLKELMNDGFTLAYDEFMSGGQGRKQFREAINKYILQSSEVDVDKMVEEIECLQVENERLRYLSTSKVKEECPAREDKRHEVYIDPVTGKSSCIRCGKFGMGWDLRDIKKHEKTLGIN